MNEIPHLNFLLKNMGSGMSIDLLARTATLFSLAIRLVKYIAGGRAGCVYWWGKKTSAPFSIPMIRKREGKFRQVKFRKRSPVARKSLMRGSGLPNLQVLR